MLRTSLRAAARTRVSAAPAYTTTTPSAFRSLATSSSSNAAPTSSLRSFVTSSLLLVGTGAFLVYAYDSRAGIHRWVLQPAMMALTANDPEQAHELAINFLASGLAPVDCGIDDEVLATEVWGRKFDNPIGIAAGFDKHAAAIDGLFKLGFGYVEIGSVTPEPQPGNPKPRVFRVPEIESVINRYGFNSEGHKAVLARLRNRVRQFVSQAASSLPASIFPPPPPHAHPDYDVIAQFLTSPAGADALVADSTNLPRSLAHGRVLGVNLGKNKTSDPDSIADFVNGVKTLGPYADVLVVNVSSPNTPGLRDLQGKGMLAELLEGVVKARNSLTSPVKPPVLVKIAPDVDAGHLLDIAEVVTSVGVDGVIVSNTTISRPLGDNPTLGEVGGLSGPPVKPLALKALSALYEATDGKVPLIGCGGISSGQDAIDFAKAGASLVQMYTGFIYGGVGLPRQVKDEVTAILKRENKTWSEIVGSGRVKKVEAAPTTINKKEKDSTPAVLLDENALSDLLGAPIPPPSSSSSSTPTLTEVKADLAHILSQIHAYETSPHPSTTPLIIDPTTTSPFPNQDLLPPRTKGHKPSIDESALAIPAEALLDEKAIAVLLDPAKAQVDAGVAKEPVKVVVEEEKVKPSLKEGKRWV